MKKCILIRYFDNIKDYKLWSPLTKKIIFSRDVISKELSVILDPKQPKEKDKEKRVHFEFKHESAPWEEQRDGHENEDEEEEDKGLEIIID